MSETRTKMEPILSFDLRKLEFSPTENPLIETNDIRVRKKLVRTRSSKDLMDPSTGEISGASIIHTVETVDEEHFVKVFVDGTKLAFNLSRTAARVFQAILGAYQSEAMSGGYAESVTLYWFGEGLNGKAIDMSEKTFQRGLKELLEKKFISPKIPNVYWVNPALFFKGDRVAFFREYRKTKNKSEMIEPTQNRSGLAQ